MSKSALIAETNKILIESLAGTLSNFGFKVIGTTSEESDIVDLTLKTRPDLLAFDFRLSRDGVKLTDLKRLKVQLPQMKIIVMRFHEAANQFAELILKAGFDAFWNKSDSRDAFIQKLKLLFPK